MTRVSDHSQRPACHHRRKRRCAWGASSATSGEFWLNLQKLYELRRAEQKHGAEIARLPTLEASQGVHATG